MSGFHHCLLRKRSGMLLARATDACTGLLSLISAQGAELQAATHSPLSFFLGGYFDESSKFWPAFVVVSRCSFLQVVLLRSLSTRSSHAGAVHANRFAVQRL